MWIDLPDEADDGRYEEGLLIDTLAGWEGLAKDVGLSTRIPLTQPWALQIPCFRVPHGPKWYLQICRPLSKMSRSHGILLNRIYVSVCVYFIRGYGVCKMPRGTVEQQRDGCKDRW